MVGEGVAFGVLVETTSLVVGVGFLVTPVVGSIVGDSTSTGVGVMKITRIALSSGTGESTCRFDITTPIITTTKITTPVMRVSAAIVFRLSSIPVVYGYLSINGKSIHKSFTFFQSSLLDICPHVRIKIKILIHLLDG